MTRSAPLRGVAGRLGLLALFLALATPLLLVGISRARAQVRATAVRSTPQAPAQAASATDARATSAPARVASVTRVNFKQLSDRQARSRAPLTIGPPTPHAAPAPMTIRESGEGADTATITSPTVTAAAGGDGDSFEGPGPAGQSDEGGPLVPSPTPSSNYLAQEDSPKVGTTTVTIPPDTMGAVGLDKVFTTLNNNYRVHNKLTGAPLSTVSGDSFWASTGATGVFDPRVLYDPYQNRWLISCVSNAGTANSSVLVGVSDTSDPQGTYTLYRIVTGCAAGAAGCNANGEWSDFPMLGFNKNWVAIGWNQFTNTTNAFVGGKMLVLNYPSLRAGTAAGTIFTNASAATGFCMHPATTFSATEETLYVPTHQQSGGAFYRLHKITGTAAAPVYTLDTTARVRTGGGWTQPGGNNLPQQCVPGVGLPTQTCPASPMGLEAGDSFIRSNVVFRNGKIWYPQSIALPAGGLTVASRFAAQWTALNPDGTFFDGGRVDDPTAQIFNGGKHYSYPSLSVNKNNDVMLGFSEFESDDYVDSGYTVRLGTDAAGTMREPVIYKEGEDYYQKTFSGTRNRWGDYSHTVIDPINDRDMWTIQEYAALRTGTTGTGTTDSKWGTWWAKVNAAAGGNDLVISEFRLRGPGGATDEFVEVYNNSGADLTVTTLDGSAGYAIAASDGVIRCTIPTGTTIPNRGHYLCVNSTGYSLASYPAGNGTTATGDATFTADIADNVGIAIFNTANTANFSLTTRLDAVGSTSELNTLYKEGVGYPAIATTPDVEHSFYRDNCGKAGAITWLGACPSAGFVVDFNNNATDFIFVDTNGTNLGAGQRLGAPGPENLSSPVQRNAQLPGFLLDSSVGSGSPPNRVRDFTADAPNNSTFGTLSLRRRITNNTGAPVTRLRFRIIDITTFPAPSGYADLRARTSGPVVVMGINDAATCSPAPAPCTATVQGTTLEEPPTQPNGGAFNSTLSAGTVTLATPLAPGASINVQFLYGIQQTGTFKVLVNIEALP